MKSLMCKLDGSAKSFDAALTEAEYFANLCVLSQKRCLHMRLLAEELLGMASGLLELRDGAFWIDEEEGHYELHLTARTEIGAQARDKLVEASSSGKNEMHKGVSGKVRQAMEWLLNPHSAGMTAPTGVYNGMMLALDPLYQEWSLECYRESLPQEEKSQDWDELEKSVLGKLADDVRVGVKSNRVDIVIKKTF